MTTGNSILSRALAYTARTNAARMARRFIAGSSPEEVLRSVRRLRNDGYAFTLDLLGESVISDRQADRYQQDYLQLLSSLAPQVNDWPDDVLLDRDHIGPIPRVNLSIKLSALDSQFSPVDAEGTISRVAARLRPILRLAREHQAHIHFDMEQHDYKNLTLEIFRRILMEKEFRDWPDAGIVVQSYLQNSEKDLRELLAWA
ncbi:MAG: proline dehydrogenase family protein, partial [Phycisphaerae bacterium]